MKHSYVVLLSGGLDSTVNLFEAHTNGEIKLVINFNYGQKSASKETASAVELTKLLGHKLKVIDLPWFQDFGKSSLLVKGLNFPTAKDVDITNFKQSQETAKSVWVPNRNGIFLNIAAGFAESVEATHIVPGFNREEAETFPDNSKDFMKSLDTSFHFSTSNQVKVECFTDQVNKIEILRRAVDLKIPLQMMWPCYDSKDKWCGVCESCLRAKRAFRVNNIETKNYFLVSE